MAITGTKDVQADYKVLDNIKNIDEPLNITKCYYPLVGKEFFRRVFIIL